MAESKPLQETENKDSDDVFEMFCEACHREGQHEVACAFCSACVTYFCSTCLKYHARFFPGHKSLEEGDSMSQDVCTELCDTHDQEILKYYCTTCNKLVCFICKTELHKDTCSMEYLPYFVTDIKIREELSDHVTSNEDIAKRLLDITGKIDAKYDKVFASKTEVDTVIKKEKESVFAQFDEDISKLEETIHTAKRKDTSSVDKAKEKFELLKRETHNLSENIKTIQQLSKGRKYTMFLKMKQLREDFNEMNKIIEDLGKDSSDIGKVEDKVKTKSSYLIKKVKEFGHNIITSQNCFSKGAGKTAFFAENINIKASCDQEDCWISNLCILSEQYLVVCDYSNSCLKLVNLQSKKISYRRPVIRKPRAIAKTADLEIAVAREYEKDKSRSIIQFLKMTNAKQLVFMKRYILTDMYCHDITYAGDDKLIIAMSNHYFGKLQIMSLRGHVIHTIKRDDDENIIFNCPYYVNVDSTRKYFYVSDWLNDNFHKIDIDTLERYEFSPRLWHPMGITDDNDGNIYICEEGTGCIHVYHTDDTHNSNKKVLLQFNEYILKAVLFSESMSKLFVSFGDADCVKVYNIINS